MNNGLGGLVEPYQKKTVEDLVSGWLGIEPVQHRSSMLPLVKNIDGSVGFGYPQMAIDAIEAVALPGHVAKGGAYTPQDITDMAVDVGMMAAPAGYATAPIGALAMGGAKKGIDKATRKSNFGKWFGGSKVVDDMGEPLTVYHGTNSDIESFDIDKAMSVGGAGFWFGGPKTASKFANASEFTNRRGGKGRANVMPVNLKMKDPYIFDAEKSGSKPMSAIIDEAKKRKKDGVIFKNKNNKLFPGDIYLAFEPTQIKSVHNSGAYDPNDPNILRMNGGLGSLLGLMREREQ